MTLFIYSIIKRYIQIMIYIIRFHNTIFIKDSINSIFVIYNVAYILNISIISYVYIYVVYYI